MVQHIHVKPVLMFNIVKTVFYCAVIGDGGLFCTVLLQGLT